MVTMIQQINEESETLWKHHDGYGAINDKSKGNGLWCDEDSGGFEKAYIDALNELIGSSNLLTGVNSMNPNSRVFPSSAATHVIYFL